MIHRLKSLLSEYEIKTITKQNFQQVMEIYDSNYDFFMLTEGEKASMENCLEDIEQIPPNFDIERKSFIGFWKNGKAVAILDFLEGYPDKTCCWIGLLLIHQGLHRKGIGYEIINALIKTCQFKGYSSLQLGVIDNNKKAMGFWKKLGFIEMRVSKVKRENKADWDVIVMERPIA